MAKNEVRPQLYNQSNSLPRHRAKAWRRGCLLDWNLGGEKMKSLRFVVNADDLGMSEHVNHSIAECIASGTITSASIMANGPAYEDGVRIAKCSRNISIGLHLNATEYGPISRAKLAPLMEGGVFNAGLRKVPLSLPLVLAIAEEFEAQINKTKASGLNINHLNSHHHIHTVPRLFPVLVALAKRHQIRWIRPTRNIFPLGELHASSFFAAKWAWNSALKVARARRARYFGSLHDFLSTGMSFPNGSLIEIMVHPGGGGQYVAETDLLNTEWWRAHCDEAIFEAYPLKQR